jgi:putative metallohydrolase (TIGR04338 family)
VTAPAVRPRDAQRARVYRAEDAWAARLDAARQGAGLATVGGSRVLLPAERRFGTLETAADYARRVLALPALTSVFGIVGVPELRVRAGVRAAHWEAPGVIALPVPRHGEPWALRETVLLHELAHHAGETTGRCAAHLAPYPAVMLLVVAAVLGPEAELTLRVAYGDERVEVGSL